MTLRLYIHPDNPQQRLIKQAVHSLRSGGVIIYPTDTSYGLACHIGDKNALDRIRFIRRLDEKHHFTLMCRGLSEIGDYARVDNPAYRLIKHLTPGPFTFILPATREVPRRLMHPKRKTVGLRVPQNVIAQSLLQEMGEPLMSTTLILPGDTQPLTDPDDIAQFFDGKVDILIDGGYGGFDVTTMLDLTVDPPLVLRQGLGNIEELMSEN